MKDRKITINGTKHQVTLTDEEVRLFRFLAVDIDGGVWLYENKPHIECPDYGYWQPEDALEGFGELHNHEELPDIGEAWRDSLTPINVAFDPDAMADAIAALIRGRTVSDDLLAEVTALIKAGN